MNGTRDPQDYDSIQDMIDDAPDGGYDGLRTLAERTSSAVRVRTSQGGNEAELMAKLGFSAPISTLIKMAQKPYGWLRDTKITEPIELAAVKGALHLHDLVFNAPCLNRQERYNREDELSKQWERLLTAAHKKTVDDLLDKWHAADAVMLQCRVIQEQRGIDAAEPHFQEYLDERENRDTAEMDAARLPANASQYFWCEVRKFKIMAEHTYDSAMGYPTHDFGKVKDKLARGGNVHDLVAEMSWPWELSYETGMVSMADGEAHRLTLMSFYAQDLPQQTPAYYPPPYPGYPPPYPNGQQPDGEGGDQPDNRRPLFGFIGKKNPQPQQPEDPKKKPRRRARGRR